MEFYKPTKRIDLIEFYFDSDWFYFNYISDEECGWNILWVTFMKLAIKVRWARR